MKQEFRKKVPHDKKHYNVSQFNHDLIRADWSQNFSTNSVYQQLNIFCTISCEILQKHVPRKIAFVRNPLNFETKNESWFDEGCRAALDDKQEAHREHRKNPNADRQTLPRATKVTESQFRKLS